MNTNQRETIREAVVRRLQTGQSLNALSIQLGVNISTLSKMRDGDQEGLVSEEMWLNIGAKLRVEFGWQTAETADYKRIWSVCANAQELGGNSAISDEPGTGKTHSLKQYASLNKNVYYVECEEHWSKKVFLRKLAQELGLDPEYKSRTN